MLQSGVGAFSRWREQGCVLWMHGEKCGGSSERAVTVQRITGSPKAVYARSNAFEPVAGIHHHVLHACSNFSGNGAVAASKWA